MDLGIAGKTAIVCASSKGLGRGCATALAREGVTVAINGRNPRALEATAQEIRAEAGATVICVPADVTTLEGRAALLAAVPKPDILVNNAGGPPSGTFRDWNEEAWMAAVNANMITPIMLLKAVVDGMAERGFGRIVNITSRSVRAPLHHLGLSNGARAGLTGFVAGLARQVAKQNVIINNLLPGGIATKGGVATSWMLAEMRARDLAPLALLLNYANPIMAQAAAFSGIPLIDRFERDITAAIASGEEVEVDPEAGLVWLRSTAPRAP